MAMIHVSRGATSLGAFPEEEIREGLKTGRFTPADLGWREGMASWKPLSQFTEFGGTEPGPAPAPPPAQVGAAPAVTGSTTEPIAGRTGLPWEHRETRGFFNAFVETLAMVLTKPDLAFRTMRTEGGLFEPMIYGLIGGCAGALVSLVLSMGLQSMGIFAGQRDAFAMMAGMGIGMIAMIILLPVFVLVCLFIGSAIIHVCLMIVGGANKSFETTFRVLSFTHGSTGPLQMIPLCGGLIAGVWGALAALGGNGATETMRWIHV